MGPRYRCLSELKKTRTCTEESWPKAWPVPIKISIHGELGDIELVFEDTFAAFKAALKNFIDNVISKRYNENTGPILEAVNLIELGRNTNG